MIRKIFLRYSDLIFILILIVLTISVYKFLLTAPLFSVIGDAQRYNGYQTYIIKYSLETYGQFGLWDEFLSSGMSWISHPGSPLFFPTSWIVSAFFKDMMFGSRIYFFIHAGTAVAAMYFLLRVVGLKKFTSFVISAVSIATQYALIFGMNGWFEEFFGLTLLPLTIGLLWLAFTKRNYIWVILGALAMSLHFFGNSYYVFHYNVIGILWIELAFLIRELWAVFNKKKRESQGLLKYIKLNVIFWAVLVGISAVKLLPLLEFRDISARSILPLSIVEGNVLPFPFLYKILRDFIIPAGHTTPSTQWANDLAIFFIILSFIHFLIKKSFRYGVFLGLFVMGIWGYLANLVPVSLYSFFYNFLPGFNSNNYPYRFMIIIHFAFLVIVALGLDILVNKKNRILNLLGIISGLIIMVAGVSYASATTNDLKFPKAINIEEKLKNFPDFKVVKNQELNNPPILTGRIPDNLIAILSVISNEYGYEGRSYSNISSLENGLSSVSVFNGKIRSVHHSYDQIVPTYEFAITPQGSTKDGEELTAKRYKILSILNTRFQLQGKDFFEYEGCEKLNLVKKNLVKIESSDTVCEFLENRLTQLVTTSGGGLYYDKEALPRVTIISNPILLITDNRFNDYSGFIAKQIMFHSDFDINTTTIFSGGSAFLDDYDLKTLKQFSAVILVEPKIKNKKTVDNLLIHYEKGGGRVFNLKSLWKEYESIHERSGSIYKSNPAWSFSEEDEKTLREFLKSLKKEGQGEITIKKISPEESIFSVKTNSSNQVIQFSDSYYPGWKATIDGEKVPVYMADGLVKGVLIPQEGNHLVRFYYAPDSLKYGALISGFTAISILGGVLFQIFKIRRKKSTVKKIKKSA